MASHRIRGPRRHSSWSVLGDLLAVRRLTRFPGIAGHRIRRPRRHRLWSTLGDLLVVPLSAVGAVAFIVLGVGPHVLDYRTLTMLSGSMRPTASPGDLLVVRPEPLSAVRAGQILSFIAPQPGAPVVSHRIVMVHHGADGTVIHTKGDANPVADPVPVRLNGDTAWYVVRVVPKVGRVVGILDQPVIRLVSVWVLPFWICLDALQILGGPRRRTRRRRDHGARRAAPLPRAPRTPVLWARRTPLLRARRGPILGTGRRGRRAAVLVRALACAIILTVGLPAAAAAQFSSVPKSTPTYASSTLQPVGSPGGSCTRGGGGGPTSTATVTWTPSPSTYATGYTVSWTGGSTGSTTATSSPLTLNSMNHADYVFTITATYLNWVSTAQTTGTISC